MSHEWKPTRLDSPLVFIVLIHSMNAAIARDHVVKMIKRDCMEQPGNSSD